jgi:SAM-dependent methyltransferase
VFHSRHPLFDYHHDLLADQERVASYERALAAVVRPGDVVVDIGCGTGILSLLACRAGAARVYAIEVGDVGALAERVFAASEWAPSIRLIRRPSRSVDLPERANVVVGEIMGNLGLDEGILDAFVDARQRFLAPGGALVPTGVDVWLAPARLPEHHRRLVTFWGDRYGFDYRPLAGLAAQQIYRPNLTSEAPGCFSAPPAPVLQVDLCAATSSFAQGRARFAIETSGRVDALVGWFGAHLSPGVHLTNAPPHHVRGWSHALLPLETPLDLASGDTLDVSLTTREGGVWRWTGASPRGCFDHSTFSGFPRERYGAPSV